MKSKRITATIPFRLQRALASHCRRRGLRQNRVLAAIILAYLREDPHGKLRVITSLHDWETGAADRRAWKQRDRTNPDRPANGQSSTARRSGRGR